MINTQEKQLKINSLGLIALSLLLFGKFIYFCSFGFDITDEAFYLQLIDSPFDYPWVVTQFGFVYHLPFLIFGKSVFLLRLFSLGISLSLLIFILLKLINHCSINDNKIPKVLGWSLALGTSTSVLLSHMLQGRWLPTPSYNSLCIQGTLLCLLGCLPYLKGQKIVGLGQMLAIGLGGSLVFLAKPTSAVVLAVFALLVIVANDRSAFRTLLGSACTAILGLLIFIFTTDGGIQNFISRIQRGAELVGQLESKGLTELFRIDFIFIEPSYKYFFIGFSYLFATAIILPTHFPWLKKISAWILGLVTLGLNLFLLLGTQHFGILPVAALGLIGLSPLCAILTVTLYNSINSRSKGDIKKLLGTITPALVAPIAYVALTNSSQVDFYVLGQAAALGIVIFLIRELILAHSEIDKTQITRTISFLLLFLLPYLYIFGTGVNQWLALWATFSFFTIIAVRGVQFLKEEQKGPGLFMIAFMTLSLSNFHLNLALNHSYRQGDLLQSTIKSYINKARLYHNQEFALYLNQLNEFSKESLQDVTHMIDLSGQSPGTVYSLGLKSPGLPWYLGGYPGSDQFLVKTLERVPCTQLLSSWLLIGENSQIALDPSLLSNLKIQFPGNYKKIRTFERPQGSGRCNDGQCIQSIYKPLISAKHLNQLCGEGT